MKRAKKLPERFSVAAQEAFANFQRSGDLSGIPLVVMEVVFDLAPLRTAFESASGSSPSQNQLRLVEDLGFDSLVIAELIFSLEEMFPVSVQNSELVAVRTLGDLHVFISSKLSEYAS